MAPTVTVDMAHAEGFKPPQIREKLVKIGAKVVHHGRTCTPVGGLRARIPKNRWPPLDEMWVLGIWGHETYFRSSFQATPETDPLATLKADSIRATLPGGG